MVRSCYSAQVSFYRDNPSKLNTIQWYFVPDTNPQLGLDSLFYSRVWDRVEYPPDTLGEHYSPVPWKGGLPPFPVSVGGLCGTPDQWANGALTTDPVPATWPGTQIPVCCPIPANAIFGGIGVGGSAGASASAGATGCSPCPVAPKVWKAVVSGVVSGTCSTSNCEVMNGTWYLEWVHDCVWRSPIGTLNVCGDTNSEIDLLYLPTTGWYIALPEAFGNVPLVGSDFNCLGTNVFNGGSSNPHCVGTAHVVISPA